MKATLIHYQAAGYAAVCVSTMDEDRQVSAILRDFPQSNVFRIGATSGLIDVRQGRVVDERGSYPQAFAAVSRPNQAQPIVLVVLDYQHLIKNAQAYRALRDALPRVKTAGNLIVLLAPFWSLPAEIEHDIPVMDDALPSREELRHALNICTTSTKTELTRAGRFDERFFVDLPSRVEREEIASAIGRRLNVDAHAAVIADLTDSWTGAEIEELLRSAARRTKRNITRESLEAGAAEIKPLSRVRASEVSALREWGRSTLRLANTPESRPTQARKIVQNPMIPGAIADKVSQGVA